VTSRVVVAGTGAFATTLAGALAAASPAAGLTLLGRRPSAVEAAVAAVRRAATDSKALDEALGGDASASRGAAPTPGPGLGGEAIEDRVTGRVVPLGIDVDLTPYLATERPDLVVVAASLHSPYAAAAGQDRWSALLGATEFGFTGLLQAPLAVRAAQAVERTGGVLVNACYPDFVNPLLAALGLPVLCGLGNVHTLAAGLTGGSGAGARLLAHHRHLKTSPDGDQDVRAWDDLGAPVPVADALATLRTRSRRQLNDLGAAAGGRLLADLLQGEDVATSLPGPGGLPGGYPVRVNRHGCQLDLPADLSRAEAVAWNQHHAVAEGIRVADDRIELSGRAGDVLQERGVVRGPSLPVDDWATAAHRLHTTRATLTGNP
jgi:hypothetical protein